MTSPASPATASTYLMEYEDRYFELVDTGGIGIEDADNLTKHIEEQIDAAIDAAAVDPVRRRYARPASRRSTRKWPAAALRRRAGASASPTRPTTRSSTSQADEFYRLGRGKLVPVSTQQNRNRDGAAGHDPRAAAAREADDRSPAPSR